MTFREILCKHSAYWIMDFPAEEIEQFPVGDVKRAGKLAERCELYCMVGPCLSTFWSQYFSRCLN